MMKKNIDITFVSLPPSENTIPSPAFSVLKTYLKNHGLESNIIYANHIFASKIETIDISSTYHEGCETFLPFLSLLNTQPNNISDNIRVLYQCSYPDLFLQDKSMFDQLKEDLENQYENILSTIIDKIISDQSKIVGITSKFHQWIPSVLLARRIKERIPNVTIISGGWTNSQAAMDFLRLNIDVIDYAIWGEGEIPLTDLICRILGKRDKKEIQNIPRIVYASGTEIIKNTSGDKHTYVDFSENLLQPDYSDFFSSCSDLNIQGTLYPIERGRGCNWNKCSFCYLAQGYDFRVKSVEVMISEVLSLIRQYNIYQFFFTDNDVIGNDLNDFNNLLDELIKLRGSCPQFSIEMAEVISRNLTYDLIKKMSKAGFKRIQIGVEAISEQLLLDINKQQSIVDNFFAIKSAINNDIEIKGANIIMNTPNETDDMIIQSIDNLYYYRFLLKDEEFTFSTVPLAVSNYSRYLKQIKRNGNTDIWSNSDFENVLDVKYTINADPFSLMDFNSTKKSNALWGRFKQALAFYKKQKFSYKVLLSANDKNIQYEEFAGGNTVKEITFDNPIYWYIFFFLNKKKDTTCNLYNEVLKMITVSQDFFNKTINALIDEGLVCVDDKNSQITSVIDINFP